MRQLSGQALGAIAKIVDRSAQALPHWDRRRLVGLIFVTRQRRRECCCAQWVDFEAGEHWVICNPPDYIFAPQQDATRRTADERIAT